MENKGCLSAFAVIAAAIIGGLFLPNNTLLTFLAGPGNPPVYRDAPPVPDRPTTVVPAYVPPANNVDPQTDHAVSPTQCVITTVNPLVALMSEPNTFSQEVVQVPPGQYNVLAHRIVQFGPTEQSWFQIQVDGRSGWVRNDTWTINSKTNACP
jgi:hypothetical protein